MPDMRSEFPAQTKNRERWIIDTVRENQLTVYRLLGEILNDEITASRRRLSKMHKQDRDAILLPGGILTDQQIKALKE